MPEHVWLASTFAITKKSMETVFQNERFRWKSYFEMLLKSACVESLDMRAHTFPDYYQFSYFARGLRLSSCLRVLHLENSNMQGKFLILLRK
jgi:hypothetical protein